MAGDRLCGRLGGSGGGGQVLTPKGRERAVCIVGLAAAGSNLEARKGKAWDLLLDATPSVLVRRARVNRAGPWPRSSQRRNTLSQQSSAAFVPSCPHPDPGLRALAVASGARRPASCEESPTEDPSRGHSASAHHRPARAGTRTATGVEEPCQSASPRGTRAGIWRPQQRPPTPLSLSRSHLRPQLWSLAHA
eukprot:365666-Chlamydomonas_euryale.AAC.7